MRNHPLRLVTAIVFAAFALVLGTNATADPAEVRTIQFHAESVGRDLKYNIILPNGYETSTERFPVLYLLHGLTSSYLSWPRLGVPLYATNYPLIVVMPDVGNSWYINWKECDGGQKNAWEDCVIKDLIPHIDSTYRTVASRDGRAINGLSMGGYGAIVLGLRHPDLFCSIASHSGALGFAKAYRLDLERGTPPWGSDRPPSKGTNPPIDTPGFNTQEERTPRGKLFRTPADCDAYDPFKLVLDVPPEQMPHIHIDCGTEDVLIYTAREFETLLRQNDIAFTYAESSGRHTPPYWFREIGNSMAIQFNVMYRKLMGFEKIKWVRPGESGSASNTDPAEASEIK